ncbi:hypothetical protein [Saccharopolyspora rhizosphaerae]|uniref:hypothetical protein n=1 Tax=Saccharopolyspora rhizosphaerae TaxID=2492662 RepID=UPI0013159D28|nr:hypothetical protein [Saccharopolyspora rhizosphaerae]
MSFVRAISTSSGGTGAASWRACSTTTSIARPPGSACGMPGSGDVRRHHAVHEKSYR